MSTFIIGFSAGVLLTVLAGKIDLPYTADRPRWDGDPPNGRKRTRYGPAPRLAVLGVQNPPDKPPYYAVRLHESCPWYVCTEAEELPDGRLRYNDVFVPGRWESGCEVDADQWCVVEGWRSEL